MVIKEFRRKAYINVSPLVVTGLDGSLVKVVSHADTERNDSTRIEAYVVVCIHGKTIDLFLPVSVVDDPVKSDKVCTHSCTVLLHESSELSTAHHLDDILILFEGYTSAVTYMKAFAFSLLCCDDDHTIGCT